MNRFLSVLLLSLSSTLIFSACSQLAQQQSPQKEEQTSEADIPPPLYLGTVHQVFTNDKFALLRIIGPIPPEGTVLISHPADGTASRVGNLVVSSAQHARNSIIAADIRAGLVLKGDRIFKYRSISAVEENEEEEPEPFTLTDVEIDKDEAPHDIREKLKLTTGEMDPAQPEAAPSFTETTVLPDEPMVPTIPDAPANNKLDDIPDTLGGWDSI